MIIGTESKPTVRKRVPITTSTKLRKPEMQLRMEWLDDQDETIVQRLRKKGKTT